MGKRGDISQGKLASGLLGVGLASGLVAASLGVVGPANASCFNFSGIAIGGGCVASFGSIAIVIGPTPTDTEAGSLALAGDPDGFSPLNFAISVGGTATQPTFTSAGFTNTGDLPNIGNTSFATAGSSAISSGFFNLADSFGGTRSQLTSAGVGNSTLNLGSENILGARGVVNNATSLFGNENVAESANAPGEGLLGALTPGLNVAFNILGDNNGAASGAAAPPLGSGNGPLAIAGLIGVNNQNGANAVTNSDFGIELRTPFNEVTPPTSVLAAGSTQQSLVRPSLNFSPFAAGGTQQSLVRPSLNFSPGQNAASNLGKALSPGGSVLNPISSSLNEISSSLSKTFSDTGSSLNSLSKTFKKVTGGLAGGTKAGTASTSSDK